MRRWAGRAGCVLVPSEREAARAERLLDLDPACCRARVGAGTGRRPRRSPTAGRSGAAISSMPHAAGRRAREPGRCATASTSSRRSAGRCCCSRALPRASGCRLLIEAFARARPGFVRPAALVLAGGFPGEWEGEHPLDTIGRTGARDVFLAGWWEHRELCEALAAADVLVAARLARRVGLLELGMAAGVAPIAVAADDAAAVDHGQTGWLVDPGDVQGLANALVDAVNRPAERRRRGTRGARGRARA